MERTRHVPTAMVFGKSGMGKSYLCNFLLHGIGRSKKGDHTRFEIGKGKMAVTSRCKELSVERTEPPANCDMGPGGPLKMIDTPGIPDPQGRTLEFYDHIVETVRRAGGLNAFIMVFNDSNDRDHMEKDMQTYRLLLAQFAELPVFKVAVCRVKPDPDATDEEQKEELEVTRKTIKEILQHGGMSEAVQIVLIMEDPREIMRIHYFGLRNLITKMHWTPIDRWNVKTYSELRESARRLADDTARAEGLAQKKRRLQEKVEKHVESIEELKSKVQEAEDARNWSLAVAGGAALTGVGLLWGVATGLAYLGFHQNNEENYKQQIEMNRRQMHLDKEEIEAIDQELTSGIPNRKSLERDRQVLEDLEDLAHP